jgi:transmembrane sensor
MPATIDDEARLWAVRLDAGTMSPEDEALLEAWLEGDERRQGALLRAQAIDAYFDRSRALGTGSDQAPEPAFDEERAPGYGLSRRQVIAASFGGAIAATAGGAWFLWPRETLYETALGEVRRVPLSDGSFAAINTSTKLVVSMRKQDRNIKLDEGEAWFKVAHDPARPFVVAAGDVRVRAVGTAFSVRRENNGADVLVTDGVVETWIVGREAQAKRVAAGNRAFVSSVAPTIEPVAAAPQITRALAWREGQIAFDGEPLAQAISEFNRYNETKLVVDDPELAREPVVGYFNATEPQDFAQAFARVIDAHAVDDGKTIRIERNLK